MLRRLEGLWSAQQQFQTYKAELPALFTYNALLIVSSGIEPRTGTLLEDVKGLQL